MKTPALAGHELHLKEERWKYVAAVVPGVLLTAVHATMLDLPRTDIIAAMATDRYRIYWIVGSYLFGAATGMAMTGFWSGRMGLRRCYLAALALFIFAGTSCGLVSDLEQMVPLRLLAGYATGLVISSAMVLIWMAFPKDKELAMAVYGIGLYMAAFLGSILGGLLNYFFSWQTLFLINIPLGLPILAVGWFVKPRAKEPHLPPRPFDLTGFLLFSGWVLTLIVVVVLGQYWGWFCSPFFAVWFMTFVGVFSGFVLWGIFSQNPLINLRPLAMRNFGLGLVIKALFAANLYLLLGFVSSYMINLRGYQWWQGALVFLPGFVTMPIAMVIGAWRGRDQNRKARIFCGMALMALCTWIVGTHVGLYYSKIHLAGVLALWGVGAGIVIGPAMLTIFHGVAPARLAYAAGVFNIMRTLPAFAMGALLLVLLTRTSDFNFNRLRQDITCNRPIVAQTYERMETHFEGRGSSADMRKKQAQALMARWVHENARAMAFGTVLKFLAVITAIGALLVPVLHPPPVREKVLP